MPVTSWVGRGQIWAGDTPLACTIAIEQTGPMQVTVRAGSFATTGQRRRSRTTKEWEPWIEAPVTVTLAADRVVDLTSDPAHPVAYGVDLISDGMQTDVFVKRRVVGGEKYRDTPAGWTTVHALLFEFTLPPACADVNAVDIFALTVLPGFPPGTGPADWSQQTGGG